LAPRPRARPKHLHVPLHVGLRRAGIPADTHEHVTIVLAHLTPLMGAPTWPDSLHGGLRAPPKLPQTFGSPGVAVRPSKFHGGPDMAPKPDSFHGGLRAPPKLPQTFGSPGVAVRPSKFHGGPDMAPKPPTLGAPRPSRDAPRICSVSHYSLTLYQDRLAPATSVALPPLPRVLYVADGGLDVTAGARTRAASRSAWPCATPCAMVAGPGGARVPRFGLRAGPAAPPGGGGRGLGHAVAPHTG